MRESWIQLKRLLGISPATPTYEQEGQLRYVRDDGETGVLYVALGLDDDTTYLWSALVGLDANGDLTTTGDTALGNMSGDRHTVTGRIITSGSDPTVAVNAVNTTGAGVGATASITGDNQSGQLTLAPAGTPGAGTQATVTFAASVDRGDTGYGVFLSPREADALADITKVRATPVSGTQWALVANAALNLNEHQWNYWVVEYD